MNKNVKIYEWSSLCWVGRSPKRFLSVTLCFENLSSGENRATGIEQLKIGCQWDCSYITSKITWLFIHHQQDHMIVHTSPARSHDWSYITSKITRLIIHYQQDHAIVHLYHSPGCAELVGLPSGPIFWREKKTKTSNHQRRLDTVELY